MPLTLNIIGAGNLGKTLGRLFVKHQLVSIRGVCNSDQITSLKAIQFIGDGTYYSSIAELPPADITFITVPDNLILASCEALSKSQLLKPGSIVVHCSGTLTSDILISVKEKDCIIASIHPMRSFAKPALSIETYSGTYCAIEGDQQALSLIIKLFNAIGSITYEINKNNKPLYHAAGVFASNYLVTLAKQALLCMSGAGVDKETAMQVITNIMQGTITNLKKNQSPESSLTGPIQRGDIATISKHMDAFDCQEQKNLYAILGKATIGLTIHDKNKKMALETVLSSTEDLI